MPSRTPSGFSKTQFLDKERRKFDVPLPQGLVTDPDAALVEQVLHITLAEEEAVIEPQGVTDDAERKPVALRFAVSHSSPADRREGVRTPVARFLSEKGAEFYPSFAEGFVADLNAALVEQFLDIPVTQGKAAVQPNCVLDDGHR